MKSTHRASLFFLSACACASVAFVGCGGGDDSDSAGVRKDGGAARSSGGSDTMPDATVGTGTGTGGDAGAGTGSHDGGDGDGALGSSDGAAGSSDGDGGDDASPLDAGPRCNPTAAFGAGVPIDGLAALVGDEKASLTSDELTLYFGRNNGPARDIFVASRPHATDPFGAPAAVAAVNTTADEADPAVSADGSTLFFLRLNNVGYQVFVTTRGTDGIFGTPVLVPSLAAAFTDIIRPFLAADGTTFWFNAGNGGATVQSGLWNGTTVAAVTAEPAFESYEAPVLGADLLTLFVASQAVGIHVSTRATAADAFSAPVPLTGDIATRLGDTPDWLSPDGCHLYFEGTRGDAGGSELYVSTRGM